MDIGIVGDHVRSELKNLVGDIPAKMGDIAGDIGALQQALAYYQVFLYGVIINDRYQITSACCSLPI